MEEPSERIITSVKSLLGLLRQVHSGPIEILKIGKPFPWHPFDFLITQHTPLPFGITLTSLAFEKRVTVSGLLEEQTRNDNIITTKDGTWQNYPWSYPIFITTIQTHTSPSAIFRERFAPIVCCSLLCWFPLFVFDICGLVFGHNWSWEKREE